MAGAVMGHGPSVTSGRSQSGTSSPPAVHQRNEVWLTKTDIVQIADTKYGWSEHSAEVMFHVVDTNEFAQKCTNDLLERGKQNTKLVFILETPDAKPYWVTLVIGYRDEQFFAYYVDPYGKEIENSIQNHLKKYNIHCPRISDKPFQPHDSCTGVFALKSAEEITQNIFSYNFTDNIKKELRKLTFKNSKRKGAASGRSKALQDLDETEECFEKKVKHVMDKEREKGERINALEYLHKVNFSDLGKRLAYLHSQFQGHKKGTAGLVIAFDVSNSLAALIVGFRDDQVVACYFADHNTHTPDIKHILSVNSIVLILVRDNTAQESLAIARIVTNIFEMTYDYKTLAEKSLKGLTEDDIRKEKVNLTSILEARKKIEDKIERCADVLDKYVRRYSSVIKDTGKWTATQCNLLILFLEAVALEDTRLSDALGANIVESIRARIMNENERRVVSTIRSEYLVHRSGNNLNTVIKCGDVNKFIRDRVSRVACLKGLSDSLHHMIAILKRRTPGRHQQEVRLDSLFKPKNEIGQISRPKTNEEIIEYLSRTFKRLCSTNSYQNKSDKWFELVVNVIPLLECCANQNKWLDIGELREIKNQRSHFLHNFHKFSSEPVRMFELEQFIESVKHTCFKFVFSVKLYTHTHQCSSNTQEVEIRELFRVLLKDFKYDTEGFGHESATITPYSMASWLEPSTFSDPLKIFINNYVRIMHLVLNEEETQKREKKFPSQPKRYREITSADGIYVYKAFKHLKHLKHLKPEYEHAYKQDLQRSLKKDFGILKTTFDSIVSLFVDGEKTIDEKINLKIVNRIYDDVLTVFKIKEAFKGHKLNEVISFYEKRESLEAKKAFEGKLDRIRRGKIIKINGVSVSTDKFVVHLLKLFDSVLSPLRNLPKNVNEALVDETVVRFLKCCDEYFASHMSIAVRVPKKKIWKMFLKMFSTKN